MKDKLYPLAKKAQSNAYAPYSKFKVGAALVSSDGKIFSGCNVENATIGLTVCAERTAMVKAKSELPSLLVEEIVVYTSTPSPTSPCGMCLQSLVEFGTQDTKIHLSNDSGIVKTYTLKELIPHPFGPKDLNG